MEPASTSSSEANAQNSSPLKQIRTFQGDIAAALAEQEASVYSIQKAEEERAKARKVLAPGLATQRVEAVAGGARNVAVHTEAKGWWKGLLLIVGSLVLLVLAGGGVWYAYTTYKARVAIVPVDLYPTRFIRTSSTYTVDSATQTRSTLISLLAREEGRATAEGVEQILLQKGALDASPLLTTEGFLSLIGSSAPSALVRAFDEKFMLGILGGSPTHTFILIKLDSFENAFPGMLAWEKALAQELIPIIAPAGTNPTIPSSAIWEDITIQNKDARILKDAYGQTVLLYSFFNNSMLIITDNEASLRTLIQKLTAESLVH